MIWCIGLEVLRVHIMALLGVGWDFHLIFCFAPPLLSPTLQSQEKEKMHESNVSQLQLTIDRMLNEARERQKTYSNEKKQLIDDKVHKIMCRNNLTIIIINKTE